MDVHRSVKASGCDATKLKSFRVGIHRAVIDPPLLAPGDETEDRSRVASAVNYLYEKNEMTYGKNNTVADVV